MLAIHGLHHLRWRALLPDILLAGIVCEIRLIESLRRILHIEILVVLHTKGILVSFHLLGSGGVVGLVVSERLRVQYVQSLAHLIIHGRLSALDPATSGQTVDVVNALHDHVVAAWLLNHRTVGLLN